MSIQNQSVIVVKLGGTEGVDFSAICSDAVDIIKGGQKLVLVHGGSAEANALGEALGSPPKFIISPSGFSSRYTDRKTLEIFCMAVNGKINTLLTAQLQRMGVNAFGMSGVDGQLLWASRKEAIQSIENGKRKIIRDDFSGKIERVNTDLLLTLLENNYVPVVAPIALSPEGDPLNVDADRAAAMIAAALQADMLILLTAVPGLMSKYPDETSVIAYIAQAKLQQAMEAAQGRMKKKVLGAEEALQGGVKRVVIGDGRVEKPISKALAGKGTVIE